MKSRSQVLVLSSFAILAVGSVLISVSSGSEARAAADEVAAKPKPPLPTSTSTSTQSTTPPAKSTPSKSDGLKSDRIGSLADQPLAPFQANLLELASKAASKLPAKPHIKSRSRAQEKVVVTCLELEQPRRAALYIETIDNWRRGLDYADLAFYCAQRGDTTDVQHYLDLAQRVSEAVEDEGTDEDGSRGWRRDRIRSSIARTYAWLGNLEKAAEFEAGVADSEIGRVAAVMAMQADTDDFERQIASLDHVAKTGNFDQLRNALEVCAQLFNRFYDDAERRGACEELVEASSSKLPLQVRIELLMKMSGFAVEHGDRTKALALLSDAQVMLEEYPWAPEHRIPLMTQLATARHRAGDTEHARQQVQTALGVFDSERAAILGIDRAGTLRCIAETYRALGDTTTALAVYKRAVEEGADNPNARPRAEDLTATCCSMAQHGVEPDAELKARLAAICDKLGDPW
jgi:tetratricopeptide (TPR) repeat protein